MPFEKGNKIGNRFKEGNNANPNGRRNAARDILNKILDTEVDERTKRERLLNKLVNAQYASFSLNFDCFIVSRFKCRKLGT